MARSLNQCNFIGNLGQDPESKFMPNGDAVTNISIAVSDGYKDKNTGQMIDKTEWVRVVAFRRLAEVMAEYLKKGSKVFVTGKMTTRKWQDQSGQDRYSTEIVASEMQMLDSRSDQPQTGGQQAQPLQQESGLVDGSIKVVNESTSSQQQQPAPQQFNDFDDDIPF